MLNNIISKTLLMPIALYCKMSGRPWCVARAERRTPVVGGRVSSSAISFDDDVPSLGVFALKFVLMWLVIDFLFYW